MNDDELISLTAVTEIWMDACWQAWTVSRPRGGFTLPFAWEDYEQ